jgi:hypothetical protein
MSHGIAEPPGDEPGNFSIPRTMTLVLKRIVWPDGSSSTDDFNVYEGELRAGRITG